MVLKTFLREYKHIIRANIYLTYEILNELNICEFKFDKKKFHAFFCGYFYSFYIE